MSSPGDPLATLRLGPSETTQAQRDAATRTTLAHATSDTDADQLLQAIGLIPDPDRLRRSPTSPSKLAAGQGRKDPTCDSS